MGGVVSTGQDNDDLIDNLKEAEYIKTAKVEQVFRIVDRAHYYLPESRDNAYKDLAWKSGSLHLSAPCIYSEVMEALDLKEGLSFLNLGSGTGYLNTMVGFMIGPYGINHGIELHSENVNYAEERLKEFKQVAKKFDDLEFCEPVFVQGNCINLAPDNRRYDRVYCGAGCPPELKSTIQNMIKIDGILVMPVEDQLLKVKRISETEYTADNILPVSFAALHLPPTSKTPADIVVMPEVNPVSLQDQCAIVVRDTIRGTFCFDTPSSKETISKECKRHETTRLFDQESVRLPLSYLPTAQRLMIMDALGQGGDSNSDDEPTDEAFLDLQLRRHAQERQRSEERRRRDRNRGNTEDVDSSISDEEMNDLEEQHLKSTQTDSSNGRSKSVSEDIESMESEDGIVADYEGDDEDDCDEKSLSHSLEMKSRTDMNSRLASEQPSCSASNNDHVCNEIGPNNVDTDKCTEKKNLICPKKENGKMVTKPDFSLSSDEDLMINAGSSSGPIQVVTSLYPRRYKSSYSTSADASETSGFGSLGDDPFHMGSHQSNSVFLNSAYGHGEEDITDETASDSGIISKTENGSNDNSKLLKSPSGNGPSSVSFQQNKTIEEEEMDENDDESAEDHHFSTDEEDVSSYESERENVKKEKGLSEPRGPDFTAYLSSKVETLPIPNKLKLFILRYRGQTDDLA